MPDINDKKIPVWKKKIAGTQDRYSAVFNALIEATEQTMKDTELTPDNIGDKLANYISSFKEFSSNVYVCGKRFNPGYSLLHFDWMKKVVGKSAGFAAGAVASWQIGKKLKFDIPKADRLYVTNHETVKKAVRIYYPDPYKLTDLESRTGYKFDVVKFRKAMEEAIDSAGDKFFDGEWRNTMMPHILRSVFKQEMQNMYEDITRRALEEGINSQELLDNTLAAGTEIMADIAKKYSEELANNTEFLAAPLRFKKEDSNQILDGDPPDMDEKQKKRWEKYKSDMKKSEYLYFTTDAELRVMRTNVLKKIADKKPDEIEKSFKNHIDKLTAANAQKGTEDEKVASALLELRELNNRYNKRGFWNRNLFNRRKAKAEREAIKRMKTALEGKLGKDAVEKALNVREFVSPDGVNAKKIYKLKDADFGAYYTQMYTDSWKIWYNDWVDRAKQVGQTIGNVGYYAGSFVGNFTDKLSRKIVGDKVTDVSEKVLSTIYSGAKTVISTTANVVKDATVNTVVKVGGFVSNTVSSIGNTLSNGYNYLKNLWGSKSEDKAENKVENEVGKDKNEKTAEKKEEVKKEEVKEEVKVEVKEEPKKEEIKEEPESVKLISSKIVQSL